MSGRNGEKMNCDNCNKYNWYFDWCKKWKCYVNEKEVHDCFEPIVQEREVIYDGEDVEVVI